MLALLEPFNANIVLDQPNLGCAMLMGACHEKGIRTTLIKGQTRCLRDMFIRHSEELWNLANDLDQATLKEIGLSSFGKALQRTDLKRFQNELRETYHAVFIDKNPRHYLNALMLEKLQWAFFDFSKIYNHYLEKRNHAQLSIVSDYIVEVLKSGPRFIGVSLDGKFDPLSRMIRKRLKETTGLPIIIGGAMTPFIDAKDMDRLFEEEHFDYLVTGPGERTLPALLEALDGHTGLSQVSNIIYKTNGKVVANRQEDIVDLDRLPFPDYSQFDLDLYFPPKLILPLQTARGCTWRKCVFCAHHNIYRGQYRTFSVDRVLDIMRHLKQTYGCHYFTFHDEELPASRARQISESILRMGLSGMNIHTYARPTAAYTSELLAMMRKAGFSMIHWGLESGSQKILDLMQKGTNLSEISDVLEHSSRQKIANLCFLIFGFSNESEEDALQTVAFLKKHAAHIEDIVFGFFALSRFAPIGKNPLSESARNDFEVSSPESELLISLRNRTFWLRFISNFNSNNIKATSGKFAYLPDLHNRRMLIFMTSSHRLIPYSKIAPWDAAQKIESVFPVALGTVKDDEAGRSFLHPICATETAFINEFLPPKPLCMNKVEKEIFRLSDGRLSVKEVLQEIDALFSSKYAKSELTRIGFEFYGTLFRNNYALAFERSWRPDNDES